MYLILQDSVDKQRTQACRTFTPNLTNECACISRWGIDILKGQAVICQCKFSLVFVCVLASLKDKRRTLLWRKYPLARCSEEKTELIISRKHFGLQAWSLLWGNTRQSGDVKVSVSSLHLVLMESLRRLCKFLCKLVEHCANKGFLRKSI